MQVEKLADPVVPVGEVLRRVPAKQLMVLYKIGAFGTAEEMLQHIATARGKLRKGGTPDMKAAARIVLQVLQHAFSPQCVGSQCYKENVI